MIKRTERYLRSTRKGIDKIENPPHRLTQFALSALGMVNSQPDLIRISSDQRRWEYLRPDRNDKAAVLIIDDALTASLVDLHTLMQASRRHPAGPAFAWVLAADVFRREGAFGHYRLLASAAVESKNLIESLSRSRSDSMFDFTSEFLLAHEFAHVAISDQAGWILPILEMARSARDQYVDHVRNRLTAPKQTPEGYVHGVGVRMEEYSEEMLSKNLGKIVEVSDGNESLVHEVACDWTAAMAVLGHAVGTSFLEENFPNTSEGTYRRALDALFLSVRLTNLLSFLGSFRVAAENIVRSDNAYRTTSAQVEASARHTILTNLCLWFQRGVLAEITFSGAPEMCGVNAHSSLSAAFAPSLMQDKRRFHDRLYGLAEVIEPLRDPELFLSDYQETFNTAPRPGFEELAEADRLRTELRAVLKSNR